MQLRIDQQWAQIGIAQKPARLVIASRPPQVRLQQESGKLEIRQEFPRIHIDLRAAYADIGQRHPGIFGREVAAKAQQAVRDAIDRIVAEGDRLARIEDGGHPLVEIARENFSDQKELTLAVAPRHRPEIEVFGSMVIDYRVGGVKLEVEVNRPEVQYHRGYVDVYLRQKPALMINVVDSTVDVRA